MGKIFLSYRREDAAADATALYQTLAAEFGADLLFKDVDDIPPGADWRAAVSRSISASDVVVLLIGPDWRLSAPIELELREALRFRLTIIPVLVRQADIQQLMVGLPPDMRSIVDLNAATVEYDSWGRDVAPVIDAIRTELRLDPLRPADSALAGFHGGGRDRHAASGATARKWPDNRITLIATIAAVCIALAAIIVVTLDKSETKASTASDPPISASAPDSTGTTQDTTISAPTTATSTPPPTGTSTTVRQSTATVALTPTTSKTPYTPLSTDNVAASHDPAWGAEVVLACGKTGDTRRVVSFDATTNGAGEARLMYSSPEGGKIYQLEVGGEFDVKYQLLWAITGVFLGPWPVPLVTDGC